MSQILDRMFAETEETDSSQLASSDILTRMFNDYEGEQKVEPEQGLWDKAQGLFEGAVEGVAKGKMTPINIPPYENDIPYQEDSIPSTAAHLNPFTHNQPEGESVNNPIIDYPVKAIEYPVAAAETAVAWASGAISWIPSTIAGIAGAIAGDDPTKTSAKWAKAAQDYTQYTPQTQSGKDSYELSMKPLALWQKYVSTPAAKQTKKWLGDNTSGVIGELLIQLGGDFLGFAGLHQAVKGIAKGVDAVAKKGKGEAKSPTVFVDDVLRQMHEDLSKELLDKANKTPDEMQLIQQQRDLLSERLQELDKQNPTETFNREQSQKRIKEVGIENYLKEIASIKEKSTVPIVEKKVPSVELNNVETVKDTSALDQFDYEEFMRGTEEDIFFDEPAVPLGGETQAGWDIHEIAFDTKKEASEKLSEYTEIFPDEAIDDFQVVKVDDKYHMAKRRGSEYLDEMKTVEEIDAKILEISPEEMSSMVEESIANGKGPSQKTLALLEKLEEADSIIAQEAEQNLIAMIDDLNQKIKEQSIEPEAKVKSVADWEKLLVDEDLGELGSLDTVSFDDLNDYETMQNSYGSEVNLYSGLPLDKLINIFKKITAEHAGSLEQAQKSPFFGVAAKFSTEGPFRRMGWPELGLAFKKQFSTADYYKDQTLNHVRELSDLRLSKKEMGELSLLYELKEKDRGELTEKQKKGVKLLDKYYAKAAIDLKKLNGIKKVFPASAIDRNLDTIKGLREKLDGANTVQATEINKSINDLIAMNRKLNGINYTPILADWFAKLHNQKSSTFSALVSSKILKQRKTVSLRDLLGETTPDGKPLITIEDLDARTILARYGERLSKAIPMLEIREAALKEGAMTRLPKVAERNGFVEMNASKYPAFKGYYVEPNFLRYWEEALVAKNQHGGAISQIFAKIKGMQFVNPAYLPYNDVKQGFMIGSFRSIKTPKYLKQALKQMTGKDAIGLEAASRNGLFSIPVDSVKKVWDRQVFDAHYPMSDRVIRNIGGMLGVDKKIGWNPIKAFNNIYELSHTIAWQLDRSARLVTYNYLIDQGFPQAQAAQLGALVHGDYSSIPIQMRNSTKKMLFTPTYKIAMSKLWMAASEGIVKGTLGKEMMRYVYEIDSIGLTKGEIKELKAAGGEPYIRYLKDKKVGKKIATTMAGTAFGMAVLNIAYDQYMIKQGYRRDKAGWKYAKEVETEDGTMELITAENGPQNLGIKFGWRLRDAVNRPDGNTFVHNFLQAIRYEVHPVIEPILYSLASGKGEDFDTIYDIADKDTDKPIKVVNFLLRRYIAAIKQVDRSEQSEEAREQFNKQFSKLGSLILGQGMSSYLRLPKEMRGPIGAARVNRMMLRQALDKIKAGEELSPEYLENIEKITMKALEVGDE